MLLVQASFVPYLDFKDVYNYKGPTTKKQNVKKYEKTTARQNKKHITKFAFRDIIALKERKKKKRGNNLKWMRYALGTNATLVYLKSPVFHP